MGGDDDRGADLLLQPGQAIKYLRRILVVKRTSWLIGQNHRRLFDHRPGDRDTLLLATGHLGGEVAGKVCDPDCVQHVHRLLSPFNSPFIQWFERRRHILQGGEGGQ